ncbi:MAG: methyltransferase domain-containing protein [Nitrospirae bacterium]|nr:MAG: methyltransferase domain-containing protein [Nitrospirota bacterium]
MELAKIERVYTSYARIYDQIFGKVFNEGRESAIRNLNVQPDERILEVGIGTGLALPMYPRHCQIVGIDFSEGMLNKAKQRAAEHRMDHVELHRMEQNVNPLQLWALVECVNEKNVNGKTHINGVKNGNVGAAYAHINGTHLSEHANGQALG